MKSKVKDKLVGIYAPASYGHTSVLEETQEFSKWFWKNHKDIDLISNKLGISTDSKDEAINRLHHLKGVKYRNSRLYKVEMVEVE